MSPLKLYKEEKTTIDKSVLVTIMLSLSTAGLTWLGSSTSEHSVNIAVNKKVIEELHERLEKNSKELRDLSRDQKVMKVRLDILKENLAKVAKK
jgi:acyl-CoA hydrolase